MSTIDYEAMRAAAERGEFRPVPGGERLTGAEAAEAGRTLAADRTAPGPPAGDAPAGGR